MIDKPIRILLDQQWTKNPNENSVDELICHLEKKYKVMMTNEKDGYFIALRLKDES